LEAQALRARRRSGSPVGDPPLDDWPAPESAERHIFGFFSHPMGYHRAVDIRFVSGPWGATPVQVWGRLLVPLVEGRATSALERTLVLADAQSGMGPPLDPLRFNYANPDLSVFLDRHPEGEWVGFDIRSSAQTEGIGLSQALIRDPRGACGRSAQTLLVTPRDE
ncbi:MAG: thioesterase family protein, partial [Myxococcota bacterium]